MLKVVRVCLAGVVVRSYLLSDLSLTAFEGATLRRIWKRWLVLFTQDPLFAFCFRYSIVHLGKIWTSQPRLGPFWTIVHLQIFLIWLLWEILTFLRSYVSDPDTVDFCCLIQDHFLLQVNFNITRYSANSTDSGNIFDLVLTNNEHLITDLSVHPDSFNSDHFPVPFVVQRMWIGKSIVTRRQTLMVSGVRQTISPGTPWFHAVT